MLGLACDTRCYYNVRDEKIGSSTTLGFQRSLVNRLRFTTKGKPLTHCGLAASNLVNICSDNDLLPDGTKPLHEPMLIDHQWGHAISQEMLRISILDVNVKIVNLRLQLNLPEFTGLSEVGLLGQLRI